MVSCLNFMVKMIRKKKSIKSGINYYKNKFALKFKQDTNNDIVGGNPM